MRKWIFRLLLLGAILYFGNEVDTDAHNYIAHRPQAATSRQKATHLAVFVSDSGREIGSCTATAIGPHAFITAQHCNDDDRLPKVKLDFATQQHRLLGHESDGRDHVIYFTDATFTNVIPYKAKQGAHGIVSVYGCGGWEYPCSLKRGAVLDVFDPSDQDAAE